MLNTCSTGVDNNKFFDHTLYNFSQCMTVLDEQSNQTVHATETTFRIIESLRRLGEAGVSAIAKEIDEPKSTVHNHLATLEQNDYVVQTDEVYRLGLKLFTLGNAVRYGPYKDLLKAARSEVNVLAEKTEEEAQIMVEEHGIGIYLYQATSDQAIRTDVRAGSKVQLHCTATGKAILAFLPEDRLQQIIDTHGLPELTEKTITDPDTLRDELQTIREEKIAFDDGERIKGTRTVARPLLNDENDVMGALSVCGPTMRIDDELFEDRYPVLLEQAARIIELNATHT